MPEQLQLPTHYAFQDIRGKPFGRLTVVSFAGVVKHKAHWLCRCECGVEKVIDGSSLRCGLTESCGCLRNERTRAANTTHGLGRVPEYRVWDAMKQRCTNPKNSRYGRYGGRGIRVCDRWLNSFENFYADMGPRPSADHQIDRIENDGNYEPGNCRWATVQQNQSNTCRNHLIAHRGRTQTLAAWGIELGINAAVIQLRINRLGWSVERALTTPVRPLARLRVRKAG